jgi:hypothetical protein
VEDSRILNQRSAAGRKLEIRTGGRLRLAGHSRPGTALVLTALLLARFAPENPRTSPPRESDVRCLPREYNSEDSAWKIAAAHSKKAALPRLRGSLLARASAVQGLAPGSLFYLSFAASGLSNVLCRVESRSIPSPSSPTVTLQFIEDRGYLNTPDYVVVEVWDAPGTVKKGEWKFDLDGGGAIGNAELVAALGSETDFWFKAYNQRDGLWSLACAQLKVYFV